MSESIFHYTNIAGLVGILESNSIHATHYRYLNDLSEGQLIEGFLVSIFENEFAEIVPRLIREGALSPEIYQKYGEKVHRLEAEKLVRAFVSTTNKTTPLYVASFCKHPSSDISYHHGLLSQWRGYAGVAGFAIEFDEGEIDELMRLDMKKNVYSVFKSGPVFYQDHEKLLPTAEFHGVAEQALKALFKSKGIERTDSLKSKKFGELYIPFVTALPFMKNASFAEENEYRVVVACYRPSVLKNAQRPASTLRFRDRGNILTPYVALFEGLERKLPIKAIIVGPHPLQDRQKEAVELLCEKFEVSTEVKTSAVPFKF